jgi:N-acetylneuraminate synthase
MKNLLIAEIGSVHDGSFGNALKLIHLAKNSGANAVKFQYHMPEFETSFDAPSPYYFKNESRWEYFSRISFTKKQWHELYKEAKKIKLKFIVSPFSTEALENLNETGVDIIKIASGEVTNTFMLKKIALQKKPVILSTGMSSWDEIFDAVKIFKSKKCDLTVMQCSSKYPCPEKDVGLNLITEYKKHFKCNIGLSDHTMGYAASISAAALGATCIEKHLTFHNGMYGSDSPNAMTPDKFKVLSEELFSTWKMKKFNVDKNKISQYKDMRRVFQKSIFINKTMSKGDYINIKDLSFKKPGDGIPSNEYLKIIKKKVNKKLPVGHKLKRSDIEK